MMVLIVMMMLSAATEEEVLMRDVTRATKTKTVLVTPAALLQLPHESAHLLLTSPPEGVGFRLWALGQFKAKFRVYGLGFRVCGLGFRV